MLQKQRGSILLVQNPRGDLVDFQGIFIVGSTFIRLLAEGI